MLTPIVIAIMHAGFLLPFTGSGGNCSPTIAQCSTCLVAIIAAILTLYDATPFFSVESGKRRFSAPLAPLVLPSGHWRWGTDASPFDATSTGGGTILKNSSCAYYDYSGARADCSAFNGVYVLNDGSALRGFAELDILLAGGRKLLVVGDSISSHLGRSVACMNGTTLGIDRELITTADLPSGGRVDTMNLRKVGFVREYAGTVAALFADYDFVLVNYGAWYQERDEFLQDLDEVMEALAAMNIERGRAGLFISMLPPHFASPEGSFVLEDHRTCDVPTPCLQETSIAVLAAAGYSASARARGPSNTVTACRPRPAGMLQEWNAVIESRAQAYGVPYVDQQRIFDNGFYAHHRKGIRYLDCFHICWNRALYAAVWDTIIRTLLYTDSLKVGTPAQPQLSLSVERLCPRHEVLLLPRLFPIDLSDHVPQASFINVPVPDLTARRSAERPSPRPLVSLPRAALSVAIESDGLDLFRNFLLASAIETAAGGVSVTIQVSAPLGSLPFGAAVLLFLDVLYADSKILVEGESAPRSAFESVFLAHLELPPPQAKRGITSTTWRMNGGALSWAQAGAALGDSFELRVFACEADAAVGPRAGGRRLCARSEHTGCRIEPIA